MSTPSPTPGPRPGVYRRVGDIAPERVRPVAAAAQPPLRTAVKQAASKTDPRTGAQPSPWGRIGRALFTAILVCLAPIVVLGSFGWLAASAIALFMASGEPVASGRFWVLSGAATVGFVSYGWLLVWSFRASKVPNEVDKMIAAAQALRAREAAASRSARP